MTECGLCFHQCVLDEGQIGFCKGRQNIQGKIVSLNAGRFSAVALDPIEKKPLYHFYPGSMILSLGSAGCNLRCPFCQNHEISMVSPSSLHMKELSPQQIVDLAFGLQNRGNIGIAFTYNEPLINLEFILETFKLAKTQDLKTVLVTNGTLSEKYLDELLAVTDALNIDLKGFTQGIYSILSGDLDCVKTTIAKASKITHVEVTTLIIPGVNDAERQMEDEARWLASLDPNLPLHLSRFFPRYQWDDLEETPVKTLKRLQSIALKHLNYVYIGNV